MSTPVVILKFMSKDELKLTRTIYTEEVDRLKSKIAEIDRFLNDHEPLVEKKRNLTIPRGGKMVRDYVLEELKGNIDKTYAGMMIVRVELKKKIKYTSPCLITEEIAILNNYYGWCCVCGNAIKSCSHNLYDDPGWIVCDYECKNDLINAFKCIGIVLPHDFLNQQTMFAS